MWSSGCLDYSVLVNILPRDLMGEYFAKGSEKGTIYGNLMEKDEETSEDHGCPKVQDLVDEDMWNCSSYPSDTRSHFTVQSASQNCLVTGQGSI